MVIIKLLVRSLQLDIELMMIRGLSLLDKFVFIFTKYIVLIRNFIFWFQAGKSYVSIFGKKYFYEDKFGIAFLQSVYVDNAFLKNYIQKDAVIIDVGANIGQFNIFCKHFLGAKKVYSFEPIANTFNILKLNSPENIYHGAVSDEQSIEMYMPRATSLMTSSIQANDDDIKETADGIKLSSIESIKSESKIDLLKIDTEGSELDVLRSSIEIAKKSKYILVETSMARDSSGDILELILFLKQAMPHLKLAWFGRPYISRDGVIDACDVLFYNDSIDVIK